LLLTSTFYVLVLYYYQNIPLWNRLTICYLLLKVKYVYIFFKYTVQLSSTQPMVIYSQGI
jgi:hypothetical protein